MLINIILHKNHNYDEYKFLQKNHENNNIIVDVKTRNIKYFFR